MIPLTLEEAAAACGGRLEAGDPRAVVAGVAIDSRAIASGDLFVALRGETFDGGDFAGVALGAGAVAAVVSHKTASAMRAGAPRIVVEDGQRALGSLAAAVRRRSTARSWPSPAASARPRPRTFSRPFSRRWRGWWPRTATSTTRSACPSLCSSSSRAPRCWSARSPCGSRSDRRSRRHRQTRRGRHHQHRPGASRARRHHRGGRCRQGRDYRRAGQGRPRGARRRSPARAPSALPYRPSRHVRRRERQRLRGRVPGPGVRDARPDRRLRAPRRLRFQLQRRPLPAGCSGGHRRVHRDRLQPRGSQAGGALRRVLGPARSARGAAPGRPAVERRLQRQPAVDESRDRPPLRGGRRPAARGRARRHVRARPGRGGVPSRSRPVRGRQGRPRTGRRCSGARLPGGV